MSKEKKEVPQEAKKPVEKIEAEAKAKNIQRVYCGPSVKNVATQYRVFDGEVPPELDAFIKAHPIAGGLLVPVDRFAEVRQRLETAGTAEAILFEKIKKEI